MFLFGSFVNSPPLLPRQPGSNDKIFDFSSTLWLWITWLRSLLRTIIPLVWSLLCRFNLGNVWVTLCWEGQRLLAWSWHLKRRERVTVSIKGILYKLLVFYTSCLNIILQREGAGLITRNICWWGHKLTLTFDRRVKSHQDHINLLTWKKKHDIHLKFYTFCHFPTTNCKYCIEIWYHTLKLNMRLICKHKEIDAWNRK